MPESEACTRASGVSVRDAFIRPFAWAPPPVVTVSKNPGVSDGLAVIKGASFHSYGYGYLPYDDGNVGCSL
jgi:hypothetical protein